MQSRYGRWPKSRVRFDYSGRRLHWLACTFHAQPMVKVAGSCSSTRSKTVTLWFVNALQTLWSGNQWLSASAFRWNQKGRRKRFTQKAQYWMLHVMQIVVKNSNCPRQLFFFGHAKFWTKKWKVCRCKDVRRQKEKPKLRLRRWKNGFLDGVLRRSCWNVSQWQNCSKNNNGGITSYRHEPKQVEIYPVKGRTRPVALTKRYMELTPPESVLIVQANWEIHRQEVVHFTTSGGKHSGKHSFSFLSDP